MPGKTITERLLTQVEKSVERYQEREVTRENTLRLLESGAPLQANEPERVTNRLNRLHLNAILPSVQEAIRERAALPVEAEPGPTPEIASTTARIALERMFGTNDLVGISYLELGTQVARSVGRVQLREGFQTLGFGTGFLISPRLLLTNNHVLASVAEARASTIEFNYQDDIRGQRGASVIFSLQPELFFVTSEALDYTVVGVAETAQDGRTPLRSFGWNRLIEQQGKVLKGEKINIIQHPNGEPKQVALRENELIDLPENFLLYRTDTAPGSSGSPLFNDQWEVLGLHHSGVPQRDEQNRILARNGQVWSQEMGEDQIAWKANEGIRISRILADLKTRTLNTAGQGLRHEIFAAGTFAPGERTDRLEGNAHQREDSSTRDNVTDAEGGETNMEKNGKRTDSTSQKSQSDGVTDGDTVTWNIPLQISVRIGTPAATSANPQSSAAAAFVGTQINRTQGENDTTDRQTAETEDEGSHGEELDEGIKESLSLLERGRRAVAAHYVPADDTDNATAYYQSLETSGSSTQFYIALSQLLAQTHTNKPRYAPAIQLYPFIDLHEDGQIHSIYSGKTVEAERFIREDFRIDQLRERRQRQMEARLEQTIGRESATFEAAFAERLDLLEAQLPYNCEHVVPQSWFDKAEPMRGDLHHLFACEVACNSFRSNIPYFDFADFEEVDRQACGRRVELKFEPGHGKGAVARATLYFLLRYPGQINDNQHEYTRERLSVLLGFHEQFPVEDYERHRNAAIFAVQGNRNPLIDHPEWAARIDFTEGLGT